MDSSPVQTYEVVLDNFSGPLDLLLHLIRRQEVSIHDIPIAVITDQYLEYLHTMEHLSLDIASEFVVVAATLLAIKSRMLLPRPQVAAEVVDEQDPRAELVQQLLEYQRVKWAVEQLRSRQLSASLVYTRDALDLTPYAPSDPPPLSGVNLWDLVDAFRRLHNPLPRVTPPAHIGGHVVSVEQMMEVLMDRLRVRGRCLFAELVEFVSNRRDMVSCFLALLELVKSRAAVCEQTVPFADITISLGDAS